MLREKMFQPRKGQQTVAIILCLIAALLLGFGIFNSFKKNTDTPVEFYTVKTSEDKYASMDVVYLESFAEKGSETYYISEDNYEAYIIRVSDKMFNDMKKQFEQMGYLNYHITGYTKKISAEMKKYAIDAVKEIYDLDSFSIADFNNAFGTCYLDCVYNPNGSVAAAFYLFAAVFAIIGLTLFFTYRNEKKTLENIQLQYDGDDIYRQLTSDTAEYLKKVNVYFTEDYLIRLKGKNGPISSAVKYGEIAWSYLINHKQYFITVGRDIMLCLKNGSKIQLNGVPVSDKDKSIEEFYEKLAQKNDDILLGYNKACIERYNEFINEYRNNPNDELRVIPVYQQEDNTADNAETEKESEKEDI